MSDGHNQNHQCNHSHHHHGQEADLRTESLDPASQALSRALRYCFVILKFVMICVVALFLWSGAFDVQENQQALVLRFGKVVGTGSKALKKPGWHWAWPYIDEKIYLPTNNVSHEVFLDAVEESGGVGFWYYLSEREKENPRKKIPSNIPLQFVRDGYSLTSSSSAIAQSETGLSDAEVADYNIVHTRWVIKYRVSDPLVFFKKVWDGSDPDQKQVKMLLRRVLADAVIVTSANSDIENILWGQHEAYREKVQNRMRTRLKSLDIGITVEKLLLPKIQTPRQVQEAFEAAQWAGVRSKQQESEARGEESKIISSAEADASNIIASAEAYRKIKVASARADARYMKEVLEKIEKAAQEKVPTTAPDYQAKRREVYNRLRAVTIDELYQEMVREVMGNVDEIFAPPSTGSGLTEWRVYLSRNPQLKSAQARKKEKEKKTKVPTGPGGR